MVNPWRLLTDRGRLFLVLGAAVLLTAMLVGHRDLLWVGLFFLLLPVVAVLVVHRSRLSLTCERTVTPREVPLGDDVTATLRLAKTGRLPGALLQFEDAVDPALGARPRFEIQSLRGTWERTVHYRLAGRLRGRHHTGPLLVRTSDPFGLARWDRQFAARSEVLVTPRLHPLGAMRNAQGAGASGESRPQKVGLSGSDDVLVREYRHGDDLRRVHWRSSARRGELMVRREEQAWDPTATVLIDSRASSHSGRGTTSSLEWAVSAGASIALHFLADNYAVSVSAADGPLATRRSDQGPTGTRALILHELTDLTPSPETDLRRVLTSLSRTSAGQLMVAVCGRLTAADAEALVRSRRQRAQAMALVLDVDGFAARAGLPAADAETRTAHRRAVATLRENRWRVVEVEAGTTVPEAWRDLERVGELVA